MARVAGWLTFGFLHVEFHCMPMSLSHFFASLLRFLLYFLLCRLILPPLAALCRPHQRLGRAGM